MISLSDWFREKISDFTTAQAQYELDLQTKFQEGQASIVLPSPNDPSAQYTQADMDKLAEVVRGENAQAVAAKDARIAELEADQSAVVVAAVDAKVAEVIADFENAELDNLAAIAKHKKV